MQQSLKEMKYEDTKLAFPITDCPNNFNWRNVIATFQVHKIKEFFLRKDLI